MKLLVRKLSLILYFILISLNSFSQSKSSDKLPINFIKAFYHDYITESAKIKNEKKINVVKKKYCSEKLINKIKVDLESGNIDYDMFLNAQDVDKNWLKTISVKRTNKTNQYLVSFFDDYEKKIIKIKLNLIYKSGKYYIDDIL